MSFWFYSTDGIDLLAFGQSKLLAVGPAGAVLLDRRSGEALAESELDLDFFGGSGSIDLGQIEVEVRDGWIVGDGPPESLAVGSDLGAFDFANELPGLTIRGGRRSWPFAVTSPFVDELAPVGHGGWAFVALSSGDLLAVELDERSISDAAEAWSKR